LVGKASKATRVTGKEATEPDLAEFK